MKVVTLEFKVTDDAQVRQIGELHAAVGAACRTMAKRHGFEQYANIASLLKLLQNDALMMEFLDEVKIEVLETLPGYKKGERAPACYQQKKTELRGARPKKLSGETN